MQNPREGKISRPVLGKMSIQETNNTIIRVAESIKSITDKISTQNENPFPPETAKSKSEDEIFGKITVKMVSGIPEFEEMYLLKLRIQQDNKYSLFYRSTNNTQGSMPVTSTNSSIYLPHSGSFFLRRQMSASPE